MHVEFDAETKAEASQNELFIQQIIIVSIHDKLMGVDIQGGHCISFKVKIFSYLT